MTQSTKSLTDRIADYWEKMGRINMLSPLAANESMMDTVAENLKNQRAENEFVRRKMWGKSSKTGSEADDDMRVTVLGDYQQTSQRSESTLGKLALGLGLLATGAGLPAAAWIATQSKPAETIREVIEGESTSETVEVGEPIIVTE